jgi:hypothetical protein
MGLPQLDFAMRYICMRQLRLSLTLPIVQFFLAVALLICADKASAPRGLDTLFIPTARMVRSGINAPALVFQRTLVALLPIDRIDQPPLSFFGVGVEELLFMASVVGLWYLVGRVLDRRRLPGVPKRMVAIDVWRNLLLLLLGVFLFFLGLVPLRHPGNFNNPSGNIAQGVLILLWALALLVFPTRSLVTGIRRRLAEG